MRTSAGDRRGRRRRAARRRGALWAEAARGGALAALAAFALGGLAAGCREREPGAGGPQGGELPPAVVVLKEATAGPLRVTQRYQGEVWARAEASLSAEAAGRVSRVHVVEGDRVQRGDVLVELVDHLATAQASAARADQVQAREQAAQADRERERFEYLARHKVASELEAEQKRAAYLSARAAQTASRARAEVERERVQRHQVVAPFSGVVSRRAVDPGDWMSVGAVAVELVDVEALEVLTPVPGRALERVVQGAQLRLEQAGRQVAAHVATAVPAVDRETRTALVRVLPDERAAWLLAGSAVNVLVDVEVAGGTVVPLDAVTYGVADRAVFTVREGKAARVPVELLEIAGAQALVRGAVAPGDAVVVRGNERLMPGQRVQVAPVTSPEAPGQAPPAEVGAERGSGDGAKGRERP